MADLDDRIRKELDARIDQLRPLVRELERLERAAAALARALPGLGARPPAPAPAKPRSKPAGRSTRAKPAARKPPGQRRGTASGRPPAPAAAKAQSRPAGRATRAEPAARRPPAQPRVAASGRTPAPRGQTQAKVLAALRAAPGSTAAVATAAGIPTNVAAATISRLVKQGRVRRLDEGGYAPVEAAQIGAAPAHTDAAAASDTPGSAAPPAATGTEPPR